MYVYTICISKIQGIVSAVVLSEKIVNREGKRKGVVFLGVRFQKANIWNGGAIRLKDRDFALLLRNTRKSEEVRQESRVVPLKYLIKGQIFFICIQTFA